MSNSSLINYTKISPNSNNPRNDKIKKITIHHMAGNLSVEACGKIFASPTRQGSSNYGIGSDGRVGMYVEEKNRAWTSGSRENDNQAVTIEVANDGGASTNWHVSDKALAKLIELCVDICKRNGISKLNYTGDKSGNLTRHNMFQNTNCPGPYLQSKFPYIADEVNKRLGSSPVSSSITYQTYDNVKNKWLPNVKAGTSEFAGNLGNGVSGVYIDKYTYRVHDKVKGTWLPWVVGRKDYAGNLPNDIDAIQIKGNVTYRVYDNVKKSWLPWVTGEKDYAGNLKHSVGGIQIK